MSTKLQQLLEELKELHLYYAEGLFFINSTETVILKEHLDELITKYTETIN